MRLEREEQKQIDIKIETERQKRSNNVGNDDDNDVDSRRFDAMRKIVESGRQDDAFFLCDQDELVRNFKYWTDKLKNVTPYFDTGCNNSEMVLSTLAGLGAKFSCQNKLEMEKLSKIGVPPQDIFFGSSVKVASHLRFANTYGVEVMAFETAAEIAKIKKNSPDARLIYRLNFPANTFSIPAISELLTAATNADLKVIGVTINLTDTGLIHFQKSVSVARLIFAIGKSLGHDLCLLDLGELVPDPHRLQEFEELAVCMQQCVTSQFRTLDNFGEMKVFANPSNFIVNSAFSVAAKVIGKRVAKNDVSTVSYVVNDGIFGAFGRLLTDDDCVLEPRPLTRNVPSLSSSRVCDVFGPSGHDIDQICFGYTMSDLDIGDWLVFDNMGAFAMNQWDNSYQAQEGENLYSLHGALLVADNCWFYSKHVDSDDASLNDVEVVSSVAIDSDENESDNDDVCAFYQLPDVDHDEEKFFTLLR